MFLCNLAAAAALMLASPGDPTVVSSTPALYGGQVYAINVYSNGAVAVQDMAGGLSFMVSARSEFAGIDYSVTAEVSATSTDGGRDRHRFVARWRDAQGIEHEVVTPCGSSTAGGRAACIERHKAAVALLAAAFPPVVPPAPNQGGMVQLLLSPSATTLSRTSWQPSLMTAA